MRWRHPSPCSRLTSSSLRGVPSGFDVSNVIVTPGATMSRMHLGQLANGEVLAGTDVDVIVAVVVLHQEQARVGEIVDVQELAPRRARAPHRRRPRRLQLGFVELAHQRRHDVRARQIEVVARTIQVGRHGRDEVAAILTPVRLAQPDAGDLGDGVRLVRRLERTAQQILFADRLRAVARVDARAAEVEQPRHVVRPARLHDRGVDHQVVVDELGRARAVGQDAADRARDEENIIGAVGLEPVIHRRLIAQIELVPRGAEDVGEAGGVQPAHERRADQAAMSGHIDSRIARDCVCGHRPSLPAPSVRAQDSRPGSGRVYSGVLTALPENIAS